MKLAAYDNKVRLLLALVALSAVVLAGCARSEFDKTPNTSTKPEQTTSSPAPQQQETVIKPGKKDLTVLSPEVEQPASNSVQENESSDAEAPAVKETETEAAEPKLPPDYNVQEPYDAAKPTLMGFSIDDASEAVWQRFGRPVTETVMNDGVETLKIHQYPGFVFGTTQANKIVFIEVNDAEVNPGLNQVRVGHTAANAQLALGAPASLNEYVMVYKSGGTVLKLDLDPDNGVIRSIKLFSE